MLGFLWAILLFIQMFKWQDVFILKEKMERKMENLAQKDVIVSNSI